MDDTLIVYYKEPYYKRTIGDDVIVSVDNGKITLSGAAILRYTNVDFRKTAIIEELEENSWSISGTTATYDTSVKTLVTVKGVKSVDGLRLNNKVVTVSKVSPIKIFGTGTVTGGNSADTFYFKSTGANIITDYSAEDTIRIASGTAATSTSGNDLVLTVGKGKITVTGGKDKTVTYLDSDGKHTYKKSSSGGIKYNSGGTSATLTAKYTANEFTASEYSQYKDVLVSINASKVDYNLKIVGNKRTDKIYGYEQALDKIMIFSDEKPMLVGTPTSNDVTFKGGKNLESYVPSK